MTTVKSPLATKSKTTVGEALQGALVDLIDLSLEAKQAHWNLVGRNFRSVHLQLDDVVASARLHSDTVAERAVAIGVNPDGRARTITDQSQVPQLESGYLQVDKVVAAFVDRLGGIVARMRERVTVTEDLDLMSQDVLIEVTRDLEKHYWMFQAEC